MGQPLWLKESEHKLLIGRGMLTINHHKLGALLHLVFDKKFFTNHAMLRKQFCFMNLIILDSLRTIYKKVLKVKR